MLSKDFIADLIARTDIIDIIDARVTLKKKGNNYTACCPFHHEKTPSFSVSHLKQFYHCFGCSAHGNVISFLMAYDRLAFPEAIETLADRLGIAIPQTRTQQDAPQKTHTSHYELLQKTAQYYQSQLHHSHAALTYLTNRGLSQSTLQHFEIGFAPAGWHNVHAQLGNTEVMQTILIETGVLIQNEQKKIYDRFRSRIMIPIKDSHGRIIGFGGRTLGDDTPKYLNSPETPLFHKGSELYAFYETRQANQRALDYILVVEGYMDAIALHQAGITQAVATLGTAMSEAHFQRLFRHTDKIIVCFDSDRAGKDAAWRALETSLPIIRDGLQIKFIFLPEGEDPDSFIQKQGRTAFEQQLENAVSLTDFFFQTLSKQAKLDTLEGKAKLNKLAYPLLQKIRPGVFQTLMVDRLSTLLGISAEKLDHLHPKTLAQSEPPRQKDSALKKRSNRTKLLSHIQRAIALLLQNPHLVADDALVLPNNLRTLLQPGISVLIQIFDLLKDTPTLSTGAILENWRHSNIENRLAELASYELLTPEVGLKAELHDTLQKISLLEREAEIQTLLTKANQTDLSPEEKQALMAMLKERYR